MEEEEAQATITSTFKRSATLKRASTSKVGKTLDCSRFSVKKLIKVLNKSLAYYIFKFLFND